ncbi:hypothetical protein LZF95_05855 [Algoriphagus sp. AGSA1]|uniref:hypothetical protein n=1 Tax=Algoriphagus sp. AGSA1 TaxID=2907213 RepID=UPI001F2F643B|nr:hypothetical protein [Algoriphagus sp. AGSA1]MCE7054191.1 hypothetical protein [Algoriphagus sp. AGSA1]
MKSSLPEADRHVGDNSHWGEYNACDPSVGRDSLSDGRQIRQLKNNNKHMNNDLSLLMEENLAQVWSQRDPLARMQSIQTIYTVDSTLYHVGHKTTGHESINGSVNSVLDNMPSEFSFFKLKPVVINNDMGRLIWGVGSSKESIVATGMDIAVFKDGKIESLYVFLD